MKTLVTTALLAALTLTGFAKAETPVKQPEGGTAKQPAQVKKITLEELRIMLEDMGYELKPATNKDGKVDGYHLSMQRSDLTVYGTVWMSPNGESIWVYGRLVHTADANSPAEALLAMLALNFSNASVSYDPQSKKFQVSVIIPNSGVTPAVLRSTLNHFANGVDEALKTWDKAIAKAKEAKGSPAPNPLP